MKEVICIDGNIPNTMMEKPIEGEVYEVYQSPILPNHWAIPSLPIFGEPGNYAKFRFVELSNIDETELMEQRKGELV